MARVKEVALGRPHQMKAVRHVRRVFQKRSRSRRPLGGIILADGVGIRLTGDRLCTAASPLRGDLLGRAGDGHPCDRGVPPALFERSAEIV